MAAKLKRPNCTAQAMPFDENRDPAGFNPLAMVDMWQDLHALVEQWRQKHGSNADVAATALREFAASLNEDGIRREEVNG